MNILEEWQLRTVADHARHCALARIDARLDALDYVISWYLDAGDTDEARAAMVLESDLYAERKKVLGW